MVQNNNLNDEELLAIHGPAKTIYGLYHIDLETLIKNKIYIAKEYHIQPSEVDRWQYFEYEIYLEQLNILAKKQEEENKKQQEEYGGMTSQMNPSRMMSNMNQNIGNNLKMPSIGSNMGSMKMPTINIPKI